MNWSNVFLHLFIAYVLQKCLISNLHMRRRICVQHSLNALIIYYMLLSNWPQKIIRLTYTCIFTAWKYQERDANNVLIKTLRTQKSDNYSSTEADSLLCQILYNSIHQTTCMKPTDSRSIQSIDTPISLIAKLTNFAEFFKKFTSFLFVYSDVHQWRALYKILLNSPHC